MTVHFSPSRLSALQNLNLENNPVVCYQNVVSLGAISGDFDHADYPFTNIANCSTAEYWQSTSTASQSVVFNFGSLKSISSVCIGAHNLGGETYNLEYQTVVGGAWNPILMSNGVLTSTANMTPEDNSPLIHLINITAVSLRIKTVGVSSSAPKIGLVYIGQFLSLPRKIYVGHTPIIYSKKTKKLATTSEGGEYLGTIITAQSIQSSIKQENVLPSVFRDSLLPFLESVESKPFFFAWRPDSYRAECALCWANTDYSMVNARSNGMVDISLSIQGHQPWV